MGLWKPSLKALDPLAHRSHTIVKPIQFTSFRRNEVKDKIAEDTVKATRDLVGDLAFMSTPATTASSARH